MTNYTQQELMRMRDEYLTEQDIVFTNFNDDDVFFKKMSEISKK